MLQEIFINARDLSIENISAKQLKKYNIILKFFSNFIPKLLTSFLKL